MGFDMDVAFEDSPKQVQDAVLYGKDYEVHVKFRNRYGRERQYTTGFEGVDHVDRAPALADGVGLVPREVRGVHARGAVPGV